MALGIRIKMFGRFDILIDEKSIEEALSKTRKGQTLIQYLLLHRNEFTPNQKLCEALWPNDQSSNPENALKTLVSRVRSLLTTCDERLGACIVTERSTYRWNNELDIKVDLFDFERLAKELKGVSKLTMQTSRKFDEMQEIYTGDLLAGCANEEWVASRAACLRNEYLRLAHQYVALLREREAYDTLIRVCRTALDVDAFDEELHVALMDALVKTNRNNEALLQYKHVG
ncbi:MAG: winged helix-turn-helix domain-containing protein, partial [Clostridia bacterium]|nr:winged helix-turn-helix domain-containing protein [Clostridia bacterium]